MKKWKCDKICGPCCLQTEVDSINAELCPADGEPDANWREEDEP